MPVFSQIYVPTWKCTACTSRAPYGLAQCSLFPVPPLWWALLWCSQWFWKGNNCSLVQALAPFLAWLESPGARRAFAELQRSIPGHVTNSRLPRHGRVSTNENGDQKSKASQPSSSFSCGHLFPYHSQINSLLAAAQLGRVHNVMRTSCILAGEALWM